MRFLFLLISAIIALNINAQKNVQVSGSLPNDSYNGKLIYLKGLNESFQYTTLDSVAVKNRTFKLNGKVKDLPRIGVVTLNDQFTQTLIVLESGDINVRFTSNPKDSIDEIKGGKYNSEFAEFVSYQGELMKQLQGGSIEGNIASESIVEKLKTSLNDYTVKNIQNNIGEFLLVDAVKVFDKKQVSELFSKTRTQFQSSPLGLELGSYLSTNNLSVGDVYKDVRLKNTEGRFASLSDHVGKHKVVLIDFWASWCGPCRKEIPTLIEAYKTYKDQGFEIVGVSLDENEVSWKRYINTANMTWPQISDLKGWKSDAALVYGVTSIPATYLVNEKGEIIAKNIRGEQLLLKLKELFK